MCTLCDKVGKNGEQMSELKAQIAVLTKAVQNLAPKVEKGDANLADERELDEAVTQLKKQANEAPEPANDVVEEANQAIADGQQAQFLQACRVGDLDTVRSLAPHVKIDAPFRTHDDAKQMNDSYLGGSPPIVDALVEELDADHLHRDDQGTTPFGQAVQHENFDVAAYLLEKGALVDDADQTQVHYLELRLEWPRYF